MCASKLSSGGSTVQLNRPPGEYLSPVPVRSSTIEEGLVIRALAGAVIAGAITGVARKTRTLSESGQWAAFAAGILATAAGWWWSATMIAFFVSSSLLTRWRLPEKMAKTEGTLSRATERNAKQVLANGGMFVLFAFGATYVHNERLAFAALGALAAASSDTWSTEIGTLLGGTPRMITTGAKVEPGMSGAVSGAGFGGAVAGALFIALVGCFAIPLHHERLAIAAAIGGFGGGVIDSLIGATLQSKRFCDRCRHWTERRVHACGYRTRHARGIYWLSNDLVNVCGTFAGAVIAVAAGWLLGR